MISDNKNFKLYIVIFGLTTLLLMLIILTSNAFFLLKSGEFESLDNLYTKHNKSSFAIYGSTLLDDVKHYKLFSYAKKKPDIVALGSSRTLQFREPYFSQSFYNMGYTINSIDSAEIIVNKMLLNHVPKVIIFNLDFWWFNDKVPTVKTDLSDNLMNQSFKFKLRYIKYPFDWLKQGSITLSDYFSVLLSKPKNLGIRGILRSAGISNDGSYYYTDIITGDKRLAFYDKNFQDIKDRIANGNKNFEYGDIASDLAVSKLKKILALLDKNNIKVILFFPPLPTEVNTYLSQYNYKYKYINDLKNKLNKENILVYDYFDSEKLSSSSCEFVDGLHGGDVLYLRILRDLATKQSFLKPFLNNQLINKAIAQNTGRAFSVDARITTRKEIDFLNIGCSKT